MLTITLSHTVTVNPPGAHPVLTLDQLWHTLVVKVRQPQLFVKLILSANVLEEDDDKFVKREVVFHEVCLLVLFFYPPFLKSKLK